MAGVFKNCIVIAADVDYFMFLINFIHLLLFNTRDVPLQWDIYTIFPQVELLDHYLGQMNYNFMSTNGIRVSNFWYSLDASGRKQSDFVNWESLSFREGRT